MGYEVCITIAEVNWKRKTFYCRRPTLVNGQDNCKIEGWSLGALYIFFLHYLLLSDLKRALNSILLSVSSVSLQAWGRRLTESKSMGLLVIPSVNLVMLAKS